MRYRRFGRSDLEVSEVGFGVWTLASDWWGRRRRHSRACCTPRSTPASTSSTPRRSTATAASARRCSPTCSSRSRDEIVLTTKCGYDIDAARTYPGQSERPHDWQPAVGARAARSVAATARHRLHRPLPAAQHAHRADPRRRALGRAREVPRRRQGPRARRRARPGDRLGRRRARSAARRARSSRCRPCSTCSSRSRASRSRPNPHVAEGRVGLISRVPHASDTLSGKITRDTVFPAGDHRAHRNRENMLDNFDKAETLAFLWEGTGRTIGQAAIAGILAEPGVHHRAAHVCVDRGRARVRGGIRPAAHRRRERASSTTLLARQLRRHEPLRDAAEVERRRVTTHPAVGTRRLAPDERRRQLLDVACVEFAERGFYATSMDDLALRGGRHEARLLPALPVEARAVRRGARRRGRAPARRAHRGDQ